MNRTTDVFNQGRQQVNQWGQQLGQNLGILPNNNHNGNNNNNNQNPLNYNSNFNNQNNPSSLLNNNLNNPNERPNERNSNGVLVQHNLNGFDYQQRPLIQPPGPGQTANINSMLNNQGMGPPYAVHNPDLRNTDPSSSSVSGLYSLVDSYSGNRDGHTVGNPHGVYGSNIVDNTNGGGYIIRNHRGDVINHMKQSAGYGNHGDNDNMRGKFVIVEDSGASKPHYHFVTPRDTSNNFHTQYFFKEKPPNGNIYYANNQPVRLTPPGWNDSYEHAKNTRFSTSFFAHPNIPSPYPPPFNGPKSPHDRPLFPSQVFNPPTVQEENERLKTLKNENIIPGLPSEYFNQQQRTQNFNQQFISEQQHLNPQQKLHMSHVQQSVGLDLSATIPPGQQRNLNGDLNWLQNNFGR